MEELPGPDAFPMDISAIISNFYGRAGYVHLNNDETGSITFIGTVSPAGGNLKEPVTENTKKVARCFYALEQERADKKRYPAVNPIDSYSKYIEYPEFKEYISELINPEWLEKVHELKNRLQRGKEIAEQINILVAVLVVLAEESEHVGSSLVVGIGLILSAIPDRSAPW